MLGTLLQKFYKGSLDLLLPPSCVNCRSFDAWLCQPCLEQISFITGAVCEHCGTPRKDTPAFCYQCESNPLTTIDGIRVAAFFEDNPIRTAIHQFKYRDQRVLDSILGQIMANTYRRYGLKAEIVVPVPLHKSRQKERGYNQSELLARQVGRQLDLPVNGHALTRTRNTPAQMKLTAQERHRNVLNAFHCERQVVNQSVLLIDDVCTTGATLDACAVALKKSGAAFVWGLTLAKAH